MPALKLGAASGMAELYPLLLKPKFVERIWGSRDLSPLFGAAPGDAPIGEVWLTGDECTVANGPLAGKSLGELCKQFGRDLVGETARETDRFPLLIKFLFPSDKLSVQVHPDDATAQNCGLPCGKTECWYVLKAEPGAKIGLGLKPGTTREQFARAIEEVRAEDLLNWIEVREGEMYYVDAGTVHAIGPGVVLVETQQNSDTTYRLYDYGRPRELHVEQGLGAMKEKTGAGSIQRRDETLILSSCFQVQLMKIHNTQRNSSRFGSGQYQERSERGSNWPSARIFVAVNGGGVFHGNGSSPIAFHCGDAVVLPAVVKDVDLVAQWELEFLKISLPPAGESREWAQKEGLLTEAPELPKTS